MPLGHRRLYPAAAAAGSALGSAAAGFGFDLTAAEPDFALVSG